MLDELTATGEVIWSGHGALPGRDGWIALHPADAAPLTLLPPDDEIVPGSLEERIARCARERRRLLRRAAAPARRSRERAVRDRGAVEPDLGRAGHQRHVRAGADAARRRLAGPPHRAQDAARPHVPRGIRPRGRALRRDHRRSAAAGRCWRPPSRSRRCAPPPPRACCSTGTASSRADPCRPRGCPAASRRRTACSPASSRPGTAAAAT